MWGRLSGLDNRVYHPRFGVRFGLNEMGIKELGEGWSFTEIGSGEGTENGEWLSIEHVPTTVHVELLKVERIPDPVSHLLQRTLRVHGLTDITIYPSSLGYMSGMCSVSLCPIACSLIRDRDLGRGRREGMDVQDHVHRVQRRFEGTQRRSRIRWPRHVRYGNSGASRRLGLSLH